MTGHKFCQEKLIHACPLNTSCTLIKKILFGKVVFYLRLLEYDFVQTWR